MKDKIIEEQQLVLITKANALDLFTKRELIAPLLESIKHEALKESFNASTDKGRKAIASMAYRVAQSKTYIESHGKELAAELKELPKLVDSNRKYAKDYLDALRDEVRAPLNAWEAEQEAIKLAKKVEEDHEEALHCNVEWELARKAEQERIAKDKADYEAKVLADAEIRAKSAAEENARREIIEAEARALSAEREIMRARERAEFEIKEARIKAEQMKAREDMQKLLAMEEEHKRQSAKENIEKVHFSIFNDLLNIGLNQKQAEFILDAILNKKIKALRIEY